MTFRNSTELVSAYLAHLATERRLSPLTCKNYARDIATLIRLSQSTPLDQLQVHHIRRFAAQLHGNGFSGRSLARMLSAWRGFYGYLTRDHGFGSNPCTGVRAPKSPRHLPHTLSPDEAAKLLEFSNGEDAMSLRDKAMFELCYSSGLRLAELTCIKPEDLSLSDGTARVTGKGGKIRIVPVGSKAIQAVRAWLQQREVLIGPGASALFLSRYGKKHQPALNCTATERSGCAAGDKH